MCKYISMFIYIVKSAHAHHMPAAVRAPVVKIPRPHSTKQKENVWEFSLNTTPVHFPSLHESAA